jgi:MFS family permease
MTEIAAMAPAGRRDMQGNSLGYAWYVVILLTVTQIVSYMDRFLPSLLLEPIKRELHLDDFQIGLLLGPAFVLFFITLGIPIGWLADRISRRAILAVGITFWCFMTALGSIANSFLPLFATRLGVGIGESTVVPSSMSLISDYFPRERRSRAISVFMTGTFLGAGSSFLFFGPLVHHVEALPPMTLPLLGTLQSWRLCFLIIGIPGVLLTALMLTVREPARLDEVSLGGSAVPDKPLFRDALRFIGKRWAAFGTLFVASAANLTMGALAFWNVALFKRTWGWNVAEVGTAVGLILLIGGSSGTLIGIWLTNRGLAAGRRDATLRVLFLGLVIGVPAYTVFPLMPSATIGLVALFCAHIGQAMATAAGPATLMMLAPGQMRGQVTAIYYLVISISSQLLGPPLVGLMTDGFGDPHALRYAVSLEAVIVGIPSIVLVILGFAAYRRGVVEMDGMLAQGRAAAR